LEEVFQNADVSSAAIALLAQPNFFIAMQQRSASGLKHMLLQQAVSAEFLAEILPKNAIYVV
tara:strand:+ start:393 stop:578 length:186 start_codon:yes stop_codon:yes gene_type:complete